MLLIETSTERGLIVIAEKQNILFEKALPFGFNNSTHLLPTIEEGLNSLNLKVSQLNSIAVGIGPGSYTGIRIGAAAAKSLAYAAKLPLIGLPSLMGFVPDVDGVFSAIIDAKIGGAYVLKGIANSGIVSYTSQPQLCPLEELGTYLKDVELLVTPQSEPLRSKLNKSFPNNQWKWKESGPSAHHLISLAYKKLENGEYSLDAHLELLYLRKTQAEIEKEQRSKYRPG